MAYNEYLAERVHRYLKDRFVTFNEKKMFGGIVFMVDDKMCIGIAEEELMCRIDPDLYEEALSKVGCKEMNFTGRPMKGFVFVELEALDSEDDLGYWIDLCLEYNPKAKSSKKK